MILWATYDADEPEGSPVRGSQYVTKRDLKGLAIVLALVFAVLAWIYPYFKRQAEKAQCFGNAKAIADAMRLYAQENNDRLPPAYTVVSGEAPVLVNGRPWTWASALQQYMNPRRSFKCPSAQDAEVSMVADARNTTKGLPLTYGMYVGASLASIGQISDPDRMVVVAETVNGGALGTFNPRPLLDAEGRPSPVDGFLIGYDTGNFEFDATTSRVTRLAFPGSARQAVGDGVTGRHGGKIHVVYVSGRAATVGPAFAEVFPEVETFGARRRVRLGEPWGTPPAR